MVAMGKGGKKTPDMVVKLINEEVAKNGQNATARAIGLPLYSVQKYMAGTAEPTYASLDKISRYFNVSLSDLRGETIIDKMTNFLNESLGDLGLGGTPIKYSEILKMVFEDGDPRTALLMEAHDPFEKHDEDTWWLCAATVRMIKAFPECREEIEPIIEKYWALAESQGLIKKNP